MKLKWANDFAPWTPPSYPGASVMLKDRLPYKAVEQAADLTGDQQIDHMAGRKEQYKAMREINLDDDGDRKREASRVLDMHYASFDKATVWAYGVGSVTADDGAPLEIKNRTHVLELFDDGTLPPILVDEVHRELIDRSVKPPDVGEVSAST